MQPYCPSCRIPFTGYTCPACGSRAASATGMLPNPEPPGVALTSAPQSAPARVMAGTIVALGVIGGFREFCAGTFGDESVRSESAIAAAMAVRVLAGGFAGILAGAGREKSAAIGLMTGATAAAIWAAILLYVFKQPFRTIDIVGFAVLTVIASAGAVLGRRVWPPKAELPKSRQASRGSFAADPAQGGEGAVKKMRATHWARIILAVSLTVSVFVASPMIRNWMAQGQFLDVGGPRAIPFACLTISFFAMMFSALIAGAGTGVGLRQGVYTGLIAGTICGAIYYIHGPQRTPAGLGLIEFLNWSVEKVTLQQGAVAVFGSTFLVATIGGAFASLVFPPLSGRKLHRSSPIPVSS